MAKKYIITAEQVNVMRVVVEADSFEEAEQMYYVGDLIEHDFERVGSAWSLVSVAGKISEEE